MFSDLARGVGCWNGKLQAWTDDDKASATVLPTLPQDEHHHCHGITVSPRLHVHHKRQDRPATAIPRAEPMVTPRSRPHTADNITGRSDGEIAMPKTFITRKGALVLFSASEELASMSEQDKSYMKQAQKLLKRRYGDAHISKLGKLSRLAQSILIYGDENEKSEEASISDPDNKVVLKFLHDLDKRKQDVKSQPGADPSVYLRDLKSRTNSARSRRSTLLSDSQINVDRAQGTSGLDRDLLSVNADPSQFVRSVSPSDTLHPEDRSNSRLSASGSGRKYRVLSADKLTASLKSGRYLGRTPTPSGRSHGPDTPPGSRRSSIGSLDSMMLRSWPHDDQHNLKAAVEQIPDVNEDVSLEDASITKNANSDRGSTMADVTDQQNDLIKLDTGAQPLVPMYSEMQNTHTSTDSPPQYIASDHSAVEPSLQGALYTLEQDGTEPDPVGQGVTSIRVTSRSGSVASSHSGQNTSRPGSGLDSSRPQSALDGSRPQSLTSRSRPQSAISKSRPPSGGSRSGQSPIGIVSRPSSGISKGRPSSAISQDRSRQDPDRTSCSRDEDVVLDSESFSPPAVPPSTRSASPNPDLHQDSTGTSTLDTVTMETYVKPADNVETSVTSGAGTNIADTNIADTTRTGTSHDAPKVTGGVTERKGNTEETEHSQGSKERGVVDDQADANNTEQLHVLLKDSSEQNVEVATLRQNTDFEIIEKPDSSPRISSEITETKAKDRTVESAKAKNSLTRKNSRKQFVKSLDVSQLPTEDKKASEKKEKIIKPARPVTPPKEVRRSAPRFVTKQADAKSTKGQKVMRDTPTPSSVLYQPSPLPQKSTEEIVLDQLEKEVSNIVEVGQLEDVELTAEEMELEKQLLKDRLEAAENKLKGTSPLPTRKHGKRSPSRQATSPKRGRKAKDVKEDPKEAMAKQREALREAKQQEKQRRLEEAKRLEEEIRDKEAVKQQAMEEGNKLQQTLEDEIAMMAREAAEAQELEDEAREQMAAQRRVAREEREIRKKHDLERKKQDAAKRRQHEKKMASAARQKEREMLNSIGDMEQREMIAEEERRRHEEEERLEQEREEEEERDLERQAEDEEYNLQEMERQAEEEALAFLIREREEAEARKRALQEEAEREAQALELRSQQMAEEQQKIQADLEQHAEAERQRLELERQRILELRQMEEEAMDRMRQEMEARRQTALRRRELNLDRRSNLNKLSHGQGMTRAWAFTYYVEWPRHTYEKRMGQDPKKKGFRGIKKPKPKPT